MSLYLKLAYIKKDESALIFSTKSAGYSTSRIACCPECALVFIQDFPHKGKDGKIIIKKALTDCTVTLTQGLVEATEFILRPVDIIRKIKIHVYAKRQT